MRTLKTYTPFGLNIEDSVWTIPCRSITVTGGLTCLVFFGIFVIPGTDLGQHFSDTTCILSNFLYCLFPYYLFFILCNLFLRSVLLLFPLSGARYCTVYLFIIFIYTILKLEFLLLLCISIASITCTSYFIHCVILFDL